MLESQDLATEELGFWVLLPHGKMHHNRFLTTMKPWITFEKQLVGTVMTETEKA